MSKISHVMFEVTDEQYETLVRKQLLINQGIARIIVQKTYQPLFRCFYFCYWQFGSCCYYGSDQKSLAPAVYMLKYRLSPG